MTLHDILAPMEVATFLREYVGRLHLVLRGERGRFSGVLTWKQLNDALSHLRVTDDRVSLVKKASRVPIDAFMHSSKSQDRHYLNGPAVTAHVLEGATLVVNQVDELFPAIRRLTESCEQLFHIYVQANLYAGWRNDNGFDVHWDRHDTLIVQVVGRKDWKVWEPTREYPLPGDGVGVVPRPSRDPVWEGTLEDGDVLYMPRGWWHVAFPRDEPSVHVTVGLHHSTGIDLVEWAIGRLRECTEARKDVPHWQDRGEQARWLKSLRNACTEVLGDDTIERFVADLDARAHTRPIVSLPRSSAVSTTDIEPWTPLRLVKGRRLLLRNQNGTGMVSFTVEGNEWRCHEGLAPALALLNHIDSCTLTRMRDMMDERWRPLLRPFITTLVRARVVWAEQPQDD